MKDVIVFIEEEIVEGKLHWTPSGPSIHVNGNEYSEKVRYRIDSAIGPLTQDGQNLDLQLPREVVVDIKPLSASIRSYVIESDKPENVYPPSTLHWYSHYSRLGNPAIFYLQKTDWGGKYWLTILEIASGRILFSHPIEPYEAGGLQIHKSRGEWLVTSAEAKKKDFDRLIQWFSEILASPPPSWKKLAELTKDAPLKKIAREETIGETLDPLVPESLPELVRLQIKAFLAWTFIHEEVPFDEDFGNLLNDFIPALTFGNLMINHLSSILLDKPQPRYVQYLCMAEEIAEKRGNFAETFYYVFLTLVNKDVPSVAIRVEEIEPTSIFEEIATLMNRARTDRESWIRLMLYAFNVLRIRADINFESLGLRQLVYIGNAYRWPHRHLSWYATLDDNKRFNTRFNVMVMPPRSVVEARRFLNVETVDWSVRVQNPQLRDSDGNWHVHWNRLFHSMKTKTTLSELKRRYGPKKVTPAVIPRKDAITLDLIHDGMAVLYIKPESHEQQYLPLPWDEIVKRIHNLREKGILYNTHLTDESVRTTSKQQPLQSVLLTMEGERNGIISLIRALLRYMPSCSPYIIEGGHRAYAILRLVRDEPRIVDMKEIAGLNGVTITLQELNSYDSFMNSLLDRLWQEEDSWNDDISGLLSQSIFKTLKT